jgi:hypothetical protein
MSVPAWVVQQAAEFWEQVGEQEPFPRRLRQAIAGSMPLSVVLLARPSIDAIQEWLCRNGIECRIDVPNRSLRAGLVARFGHGVAFVDGGDPEDEQRFSLAHELAHFLQDYLAPRIRTKRKVGGAALEVLDGLRPATASERLHALLGRAEIGFHVHLLDRTPAGPRAPVAAAEERADLLAYELLAPAGAVFASVEAPTPAAIAEVLRSQYGLPEAQSIDYSRRLMPTRRKDPLLAQLRTLTV